MFTFPSRESVFFFNFSLNKGQTKHKFKPLRGAATHNLPHILHLLKSLGSTSPFHSWAGQAVVVQLHQQELGYWTSWWWVSMKWKPPCPCPEDTSGVAVHTERRLEKQSLFLSMYPQDITCLSPPPKRPTLSHRSSRDLHKGPRDRDVPQNCPEPREQPHLHPGLHCQRRKPWQVNSTGTLMWWQASEWAHSQNQRCREGYFWQGPHLDPLQLLHVLLMLETPRDGSSITGEYCRGPTESNLIIPPNLSSPWFLPYCTIKMENKIKYKIRPDAETGEFTKTLREKPFFSLLHLLRDVW